MDSRFYDSLLLSPPILLGERLRPLSIGHHLILTRISSPFILGGAVKLDDCLRAIGICRRPFWSARQYILDDGTQRADAEKLGRRVGVPGPDFLRNLVRLLDEYFTAYTNLPPLWKDPKAPPAHGLPIHLQLVAAVSGLQSQVSGLSVYDFPFALAYWHLLEKTGNADRIVTESQRAKTAKLKAKYEKLKAEGKLPAPGEKRKNPASRLPLYAGRRAADRRPKTQDPRPPQSPVSSLQSQVSPEAS